MSVGEMENIPLAGSSESDTGAPDTHEYAENRPDWIGNGGNLQNYGDLNSDEEDEKQRLIQQVVELQNTLDDLSQRVDSVKEENLKLKSENQVLGQYIENLMAASSVFQSTSPKTKKK